MTKYLTRSNLREQGLIWGLQMKGMWPIMAWYVWQQKHEVTDDAVSVSSQQAVSSQKAGPG